MDKEDGAYLYNGILFNHQNGELLPFTKTCVDLESIMLSEISQQKKTKYCMISCICAILK